MKKKLFVSILMIIMGSNILLAQKDAFFTSNFDEFREDNWATELPSIPGYHGALDDYIAAPESTPIGSGLLILAAMGLAYAKKKNS